MIFTSNYYIFKSIFSYIFHNFFPGKSSDLVSQNGEHATQEPFSAKAQRESGEAAGGEDADFEGGVPPDKGGHRQLPA